MGCAVRIRRNGLLLYNKELLAAAGVDTSDAGWPKDFDGFVAALEKIKTTGVTPMGLEDYGYLWHILMYWISAEVGGSKGVGELGSGARKFNDPALVNVVTRWQELANYTAEGAETMQIADSEQLLFNNESVITTGGIWIANDCARRWARTSAWSRSRTTAPTHRL